MLAEQAECADVHQDELVGRVLAPKSSAGDCAFWLLSRFVRVP